MRSTGLATAARASGRAPVTALAQPVEQPVRAPEHRPPSPALDVLAVLAAQQQQLDDLTDVVQAQQRTLQHLLDRRDDSCRPRSHPLRRLVMGRFHRASTAAEMQARDQARAAKLQVLHATLTDQVAALRDGEDWQDWLKVAAHFHTYSFNNILLIAAQRPGATVVAGFEAWKTRPAGRQGPARHPDHRAGHPPILGRPAAIRRRRPAAHGATEGRHRRPRPAGRDGPPGRCRPGTAGPSPERVPGGARVRRQPDQR